MGRRSGSCLLVSGFQHHQLPTLMNSAPFTFALAASLTLPASAGAATVFTSQSAFLSTLKPGSYKETFTNPSANSNVSLPSKNITSGAFSYTIAGAASGLYEDGFIIGNWAASQPMVITFTAGNITAVGGEFFISDINGNFQSEAAVTITMNDGTMETWIPAGTASFRGFTSPGIAITSLTVNAAAARFNNFDNLIVGTAVPEPSGMGLLAGALLPLLSRRRRWSLPSPITLP